MSTFQQRYVIMRPKSNQANVYNNNLLCPIFLTYLDRAIAVWYKRASPNDIKQLMTNDVEVDLTLVTRVVLRSDGFKQQQQRCDIG